MSINFSVRWADNTAQLKKNLADGLQQIEATRVSVTKMVEALSGDKLITSAHRMAAAIQQIGGATKLTAAEQARANALIDKAIEKYSALGQTAPTALKDLSAALKQAQSQTESYGVAWQKLGAQLSTAGTQMQGVGSALSKTLTLPLVAIGAGAVKVGIDFESAFAGVRKTVDATEPEFKAMAQGFRNLAKEIPISVNELAKLGEAAGALGIPKDDILEFSRVMAELGVTTNVTSEQAAESIAKIQNVFGAAGKDTEKFASTLVALGNDGASTEAEILGLAQRISSAGNAIGLSQAQVLGFSSAIANVGVEAEAGGSAMSRVFIEISQAVSKGGNAVAEFARISGMSIEQFSKAFKTDAAGATTAFIEGLGKIKASGGDLISTIESLGFTELRQADLLRRLALSGDNLSKSLKLSGVAWQENTALTKEASERFKTTESQLILLGNRVKDVGITLFTALKPAIDTALAAVNSLLPAVDALAKAFAVLPGGVQLTIVGLAAVAAAAGPVLFVMGQLVGSAGLLVTALGKAQASITLVGLESVTATGRIATLRSSMGLLGPAALVVGTAWAALEIASQVAKWTGLTEAIDRSSDSQKRQAAQLQGQLSVYGNTNFVLAVMAQMFKGTGDAARDSAVEIKKAIDAHKNLKDQLSGALATKNADALAKVVREMAAAGELTSAVMQRIAPQIEALAAQGATLDPVLLSIANGFKVIAAQGSGAAQTGFTGLTASLAAARAELAKLSATDLKQLTEAFKSGAFSVDDLKKKTGLSEEALKLFQDQVQKSESAIKKLDSAQASAGKRFQEAKANLEGLFEGVNWDGTIEHALKLGASVKDLAVFFGKSEGEIKKSATAMDVWAKVAIVEANRKLQDFIGDLHKLGEAVPQKFFDDLEELPRKLFAIEHALDSNKLSSNLEKIGVIVNVLDEDAQRARLEFDRFAKETAIAFEKSQQALSSLGQSFSQLATLGGKFGAVFRVASDLTSAFEKIRDQLVIIDSTSTSTFQKMAANAQIALTFFMAWYAFLQTMWAKEDAHALKVMQDYEDLHKLQWDLLASTQALLRAYLKSGKTAADYWADMAVIQANAGQETHDNASELERLRRIQLGVNAALAAQQRLQDLTAAGWDELNDLIKQYKFTEEELGPALQQQHIVEQATAIWRAFRLLTSAGIDTNIVLEHMAGDINEVVRNAQRFGLALPSALRPIIEAMARAGLLTDQFGNAITDVNTLTFDDDLNRGINNMVDALTDLIRLIKDFLGIFDMRGPATGVPGVIHKMETAFDGVRQSIEEAIGAAGRFNQAMGSLKMPVFPSQPETPPQESGNLLIFTPRAKSQTAVVSEQEVQRTNQQSAAAAGEPQIGTYIDLQHAVAYDNRSFQQLIAEAMPPVILRDENGVRRSIKRAANG